MTARAVRRRRIAVLFLAALMLVACGESAEHSSRTDDELAVVTESPVISPAPGESAGNATTPAPQSPIYIATAHPGEVIQKEIPADPAPTTPNVPVKKSQFDKDGNGRYDYDELGAAIEAEAEDPKYEFPSNYQTSIALMMKPWETWKEGGAGWEVGMEVATLANYHTCAWEFTWLDAYADGDEALMQESLDQLRSVGLEAPTNVSIRDHMVEKHDRAALGDPTLTQQHVDQSCLMEWATPAAGTPSVLYHRSNRLDNLAFA